MNVKLPEFSLFILLVLHAQLSESYPKVVIASRDGEPYLLCQYVPPMDSTFNLTLTKGNKKQEVCMVYTDRKNTTFYSWNDKPTCNWTTSNDNSISFTLSNFDIKHTDNYTCEIRIFFPPPFRSVIINETYVYIHDLQQCDGMQVFIIWILTGLAGFLFLCCILTFCLWSQNRYRPKTAQNNTQNNECNSEYMPMASVNPAKRPIIPRL
ncbi:inducible T-cell costimulator [Xenopus laevis]|uniref:Inducible T-cell costimulator n=2 Tax=Xenopus laevis TaxID=8355 RepID=A0A974BZP8_XENLA|nr:inducible T-cell costimulator [Xenopus laevis]OCT63850.1 hypothetical protein XELAEV_18044947mg [Xenopus laevis]